MGMLVLKRCEGERVHIEVAGGITIMIVAVGDGCVRLGIDAPRSIPVHRCEVWERIERQAALQEARSCASS